MVGRLLEQGDPFGARLQSWFADRLRAEAERWNAEHVQNVAGPVRLVEFLRDSEYLSEDLRLSAKRFLLGTLTYTYAWRQLVRLRGSAPQLFSTREWAELRDRFAAYATGVLGDPGSIEDVEDLDELGAIAGDMGVSLEEEELDHARDVVREYVWSKEEQAERWPDEEPRTDPLGDARARESAQIDALFGRLERDRG